MAASAPPAGDGADGVRRLYSLSQAAVLFGVHRNTLSKWLGEGCPAVTRADRGRGVEWELDLPDVIEWRISKAVSDAAVSMGGEKGATTKEQADTRRAIAMAIKAEVEADEALKAVVYRHEVEADVASFCQELRVGLGNASAKIAGRATSMTNAAEIEDLCHAELNRSFQGARVNLAERWSSERGRDGAGAG